MSDAFGKGSLGSRGGEGGYGDLGKSLEVGTRLMVRLRWVQAVQKYTRLPRTSIAAVGGVQGLKGSYCHTMRPQKGKQPMHERSRGSASLFGKPSAAELGGQAGRAFGS
jgi:hypothetical protein